MRRICIYLYWIHGFVNKDDWVAVFAALEGVMGEKLRYLDTQDPVKRGAKRPADSATYTMDFQSEEMSRWLFGKFSRGRCTFTIRLSRDSVRNDCSIAVYLSEGVATPGEISNLFMELVSALNPFYGLCDLEEEVHAKRKKTGFSVDLEVELLGVFWLTCFGSGYQDFFGLNQITLNGVEEILSLIHI